MCPTIFLENSAKLYWNSCLENSTIRPSIFIPSCCMNSAQKFMPTLDVSIFVSKLLHDRIEIRANSTSKIHSTTSSIFVPFSAVRPHQKSILYGPFFIVLSASNSVLSFCLGMHANTQQLSSLLQLNFFSLKRSPNLMKNAKRMCPPFPNSTSWRKAKGHVI